jgi:redox-sensitive bicupin YhaK (pirin superfamily)
VGSNPTPSATGRPSGRPDRVRGETGVVSGPVSKQDTTTDEPAAAAAPPTVEVTPSREATVGRARVRRALPRRARRTVGAWCFVDHLGPTTATDEGGIDIGPHPHIGLQTVTWLLAGEVLHRDSLGSEQLIRPGQLNLMTAGRGVAHAEEGTGYRGDLHGVQLWVAQPDATRSGDPAFEHHAELPRHEGPGFEATVLVGDLDGTRTASPARRDTDHVGMDLSVHGDATLPLRADFEHALVVLAGEVVVAGEEVVRPGALAYLGLGRDELAVATAGAGDGARVLLLGGVPFDAPVLMWWNFVGRTKDEIGAAFDDWTDGDEARFGPVRSHLDRIGAPLPPWLVR